MHEGILRPRVELLQIILPDGMEQIGLRLELERMPQFIL